MPVLAAAYPGGLVPCGNGDPTDPGFTPCQLNDVFALIFNIFDFMVWYISIPLAGLIIVAGGVMLLVSGGNPGLVSLGKRMLWGAIIGILLIFCSWVIIKAVLTAIGYVGPF